MVTTGWLWYMLISLFRVDMELVEVSGGIGCEKRKGTDLPDDFLGG